LKGKIKMTDKTKKLLKNDSFILVATTLLFACLNFSNWRFELTPLDSIKYGISAVFLIPAIILTLAILIKLKIRIPNQVLFGSVGICFGTFTGATTIQAYLRYFG
jgi:hypothetical protein